MKIQNMSDMASSTPITQSQTSFSITNTIKATQPTSAQKTKQLTPEELQASIKQMSDDLKKNQVNLDFSIDKTTKEIVVKVIDSSTGDVLTQFPSEQALAISEFIANKQKGSFLNDKA